MIINNRAKIVNATVAVLMLFVAGSVRTQAQDRWGDAILAAPTNGWGSAGNGGNWQGNSSSRSQWRLGVDGSANNVGVSVNRVEPGSAAARAGILRGDLIVSVGANRVGRVGRRFIDLDDQVDRNADARGRVELLVQNRRTLQLDSVIVQLDSARESALTGQLVLPSNVRVPADAIVTVQLDNVSRPHYAVRNGHSSFRPPALSSGAIGFTLNYDRRYIFPGDTYSVSASMTSRGKTVYVTARPQLVLTRGNPTNVRMQLVPATGNAGATAINVNQTGDYSAASMSYNEISRRVTESYRKYLQRQPSVMELAAWQQIPDVERRIERLPIELMASEEYFDRVGDNNSIWIQTAFREIMGRSPSGVEFNQWMRRFADVRYSRVEVLKQMQSISGR